MLPSKTVEKLESASVFREWRGKNKKDYLSHIAALADDRGVMEISIGYYDPDSDRVTTFVLGEPVIIKPKSEIFKKGSKVEPLDISKASLSLEKVVKAAEKTVEEEYKELSPGKTISILQNLGEGEIWNITVVTSKFKLINLRIDPATGKVIAHAEVNPFR